MCSSDLFPPLALSKERAGGRPRQKTPAEKDWPAEQPMFCHLLRPRRRRSIPAHPAWPTHSKIPGFPGFSDDPHHATADLTHGSATRPPTVTVSYFHLQSPLPLHFLQRTPAASAARTTGMAANTAANPSLQMPTLLRRLPSPTRTLLPAARTCRRPESPGTKLK